LTKLSGHPSVAAAAIVAAFAVAGCGSSSGGTTSSTTTTTRPAAPAPPAQGPHGRLTADEYTTFLHVARLSDKSDKEKRLARQLALVKQECAIVSSPQTDLAAAFVRACPSVIRLFAALLALETETPGCRRAANAGDISCFAELFSRFGRAARVVVVRARAVNGTLAGRGLRGACADGLGVGSTKELQTLRSVARSARLASQALLARNQARYTAASEKLDLNAAKLDSSSGGRDVAEVRKCPHD
jgi:hypothetical protein